MYKISIPHMQLFLSYSVLLHLFFSGLGGIISKNQQRLQEGWIIRGSIGIHFVLWCLILHLPKEHILNDIPFYVRSSVYEHEVTHPPPSLI